MQYGDYIEITRDWAMSLLKRMGLQNVKLEHSTIHLFLVKNLSVKVNFLEITIMF